MKTTKLPGVIAAAILMGSGLVTGQEQKAPNASIESVKGVKQEAVSSVKKVEPPQVNPVTPPPPEGVKKVEPPQAKAVATPPPQGSAVKVDGGAVGAVANIRPVQGVQGIVPPKQMNLEAALLIKQDGEKTPTGSGAEKGGKGKAAAAALLTAPAGQAPAKPQTTQDGRAALQEFEKQTAPGS